MKKAIATVLTIFMSIEVLCRFVDDPMSADFLFNWFFWDTVIERKIRFHTQTWFDDIPVINAQGYRASGEWPPDRNTPHVIVSAAGHGFAENVLPHEGWPALLEQRLSLGETPVNVHNGSVQGATIVFTERVLMPLITESKPRAVILSMSGFNDGIRSHVPEADVVRPEAFLHNLLMGFASIRKARQGIASMRNPLQHKVPLDEFIHTYNRIIERLKAERIDVVLLQQVVVHPDIDPVWSLEDMNTYRLAQAQIGAEHNLPVIDPLPYCKPQLEDCFDGLDWYSLHGHQQVVRAIQDHPIWAELTRSR